MSLFFCIRYGHHSSMFLFWNVLNPFANFFSKPLTTPGSERKMGAVLLCVAGMDGPPPCLLKQLPTTPKELEEPGHTELSLKNFLFPCLYLFEFSVFNLLYSYANQGFLALGNMSSIFNLQQQRNCPNVWPGRVNIHFQLSLLFFGFKFFPPIKFLAMAGGRMMGDSPLGWMNVQIIGHFPFQPFF